MARVQVSIEKMVAMHNEQLEVIQSLRKKCEDLEAQQTRMIEYWYDQLPGYQPSTRSESSTSSISTTTTSCKKSRSNTCIDLSMETDEEDDYEPDAKANELEPELESEPEPEPEHIHTLYPFKKQKRIVEKKETHFDEESEDEDTYTNNLYVPSYFAGPLVLSNDVNSFRTPSPLQKSRGRPRKTPFGPKRKVGRPKNQIDESIFQMTPIE